MLNISNNKTTDIFVY